MSEIVSYSLEFLIDGAQVSLDDLKKKVAKVLDRHGLSVDWQVVHTASQHPKLSVRGSLEDVDACHLRLNADFVDEHSCIRLRDEAGDEIRQRAYPILARIEQQLRAFINQAMTEIIGFDWWDSITPFLTEQGIREGVQRVESTIGKASSAIHHPLELLLFDQLIPIITGSIQPWPADKPLSVVDLTEVLADCTSIEEVQGKLAEKTREIYLWDEVFVRYFENPDEWKNLAASLTEFVIPVRNKVMHHRPMHRWQLQRLEETEHVVDTLLASARTELPEEERAEARQVSEEWTRAWSRTLSELVRPELLTIGIIGPFLKQQEEWTRAWSRTLSELVRPELLTIGIIGPFLKQQEEWTRAWSRTARHMAQLAASGSAYVGSTDSARFHLPTCRHVKRILPENLIRFANRDEAIDSGYVPCGTCTP